MQTLLRLHDIEKAYAGVHALKRVSFDLSAGEVHALVGENGAGKSTLVKIMTGAIAADRGSIEVAGQVIDQNDPVLARRLGIAAIYQQPALFPDLTVAENMAIGLEPPGRLRHVDWGWRRRIARQLLDRIGAVIDPETEVRRLSMPEQQLVEIARALGANARVLILDEPTSSLSDQEVSRLFRIIRELKADGVGMIYISHRLDELPQVADRVTALRDGKWIGTEALSDVTRADLIRMMVGRELSQVFPERDNALGETVLETERLGCRESGIHDVSLHIRAGEVLGLAGLVGCGRTELAHILFGITPADVGVIRLRGQPVRILSPRLALRLRIGYVPEDRRRHGLISEMAVSANTTLSVLPTLSRRGLIDFARERDIAGRYASRLGIKTPTLETPAGSLSGGNQQKVALARWLATSPSLLILDEPTQGVDVGAKAEIHSLISELAAAGLAILLISSELNEVLGMSNRIAVMRQGSIVATLERDEATPDAILGIAFGHVNSSEAQS